VKIKVQKSILRDSIGSSKKRNRFFFRWKNRIAIALLGTILSLTLASCDRVTTNKYEATALTTYTWRVKYFINENEDIPRWESFASSSALNVNGQKPDTESGYLDDNGLWWPPLPPRPSIDEIEERAKPSEQHSRPELLRKVKYSLAYQEGDRTETLDTNYSVYRQAVKANSAGRSLKLTLGVNNRSVEKAEPI
jgi:hypothetical protein